MIFKENRQIFNKFCSTFSKSTVDGVSVGGGDVPPQVLQALAARQEAILTKLENLRYMD